MKGVSQRGFYPWFLSSRQNEKEEQRENMWIGGQGKAEEVKPENIYKNSRKEMRNASFWVIVAEHPYDVTSCSLVEGVLTFRRNLMPSRLRLMVVRIS